MFIRYITYQTMMKMKTIKNNKLNINLNKKNPKKVNIPDMEIKVNSAGDYILVERNLKKTSKDLN
jgi:hypothetical protein